MASDLEQKIIKQLEYYFGDINLARDKFLKEKVAEDDGWVTLETLLTFKRLASLTEDPEVICAALEKADPKLVFVSEDKKKVRRNPDLPLPELNDARRKELSERTAYAKGFPLDEDFQKILEFVETHGPIESCSRRSTRDHKFKGSVFIIFKDKDTAKKFIDAEEVKYNDTPLIRKWQMDYFAEKRKQFEELKNKKKEKKEAKKQEAKEKEKPIEFPKGAILHFTGITEDQSITREEIKEKVKEIGNGLEISFIDYKKGDLEGYARMPAENNAVELYKLLTDGELKVGDATLKFRVLEGEEEETQLKKTADAISDMRQKNRFNSRNNRKRKGNFGGNRDNKKSRKNDD